MHKYFLPFLLAATITNANESLQSSLDLHAVFWASPIIYCVLIILSIASLSIWIYSFLSFRTSRMIQKKEWNTVLTLLQEGEKERALSLCEKSSSFLAKAALPTLQVKQKNVDIMELIKAEGKRKSAHFWQKLSLLNDIAIISPMLGLLGTVIGMFYAFYDVNRSIESLSALFDGLGIAVGTTVVGLSVSIMSMILYTTSKYKLMKTLSQVENEAILLTRIK